MEHASSARVVVVGSSNMDIYSWTDRLPEPGETVIGDRHWMVMGGKGANQAVSARRLGARVSMVGRVGDDWFGQKMLDTLRAYGVKCDHMRVDPQAGSGVALVVVDKHAENTIVVIPGANMRIEAADVDAATATLHRADVVLMQLEIPLDAIERAIAIARQSKSQCILNPAPARRLPDRILSQIHLLTPNQNEARALTGISADTLEGAAAAGRALLDQGVPTVVITLGAQGALIVRPGQTRHLPGVPVDACDTSGAGDAFMAGLGVALAEGRPLEQATRFANLVGALSTTKPGAMPSMPTRAEVDAFSRTIEA